MQKKSSLVFLGIFISLLLINFISAYYYGYGSGALSDFLNSIDSSTMVLVSVFIISFVLLHFSLSRVFKGENKASAGILSFVISLLITYGINRSGFNFENLFYSIGFSGDFFYSFLPLIVIAGVIFLILKYKSAGLLVIGGLLIFTSFTDLIYEKGVVLILGIILIIIGAVFWNKWSNKDYISYSIPRKSKRY